MGARKARLVLVAGTEKRVGEIEIEIKIVRRGKREIEIEREGGAGRVAKMTHKNKRIQDLYTIFLREKKITKKCSCPELDRLHNTTQSCERPRIALTEILKINQTKQVVWLKTGRKNYSGRNAI